MNNSISSKELNNYEAAVVMPLENPVRLKGRHVIGSVILGAFTGAAAVSFYAANALNLWDENSRFYRNTQNRALLPDDVSPYSCSDSPYKCAEHMSVTKIHFALSLEKQWADLITPTLNMIKDATGWIHNTTQDTTQGLSGNSDYSSVENSFWKQSWKIHSPIYQIGEYALPIINNYGTEIAIGTLVGATTAYLVTKVYQNRK